MQTLFPNYYDKFCCIADKCKHSCCIGWEIDIDEDTMQLYDNLDGEIGERIRKNIEGEPPHFILGEKDRCPFLNEKGLCDIILECGDGAICDICYLHPRFINTYSSFEEMGIGLCCEEAVHLILTQTELFSIDMPSEFNDDEKVFFQKRREIFDILQCRRKNIKSRFDELAGKFGFEFDFSLKQLSGLFLSLERLDENWTKEIEKLEGFSFDCSIFEDESFELFFEQLAVYFVFRHLKGNNIESVLKFVLVSCWFIGALCALNKADGAGFEKFYDIVRMYSSEIEYSEENTEVLMAV